MLFALLVVASSFSGIPLSLSVGVLPPRASVAECVILLHAKYLFLALLGLHSQRVCQYLTRLVDLRHELFPQTFPNVRSLAYHFPKQNHSQSLC